jgi:Plasmid maintenance system antidote protein
MIDGEKLTILMNIFNINIRRLAQAIHVDPSSVSRWINGKRELKDTSEYFDNIINFFINDQITDSKRQKLVDLILPGSPLEKANTTLLREKLNEWLVSDQVAGIEPKASASDNNLVFDTKQAYEFLNGISNISSPSFLSASGLQNKNLSVHPMSGTKIQVEAFPGDEGIQQALLTVASALVKQDIPKELLITSQDDLSWYMHPGFLSQWMLLVAEILRKGHRIKVIFKLHRNMGNILTLIRNWLPLILTGKVEAFYYARYQDNPIGITLAIATGVGAMYSMKSQSENTHSCSYIHWDNPSVEFYSAKFKDLLLTAQPLIKTYTPLNIQSFNEEQNILDDRVCDCMTCASSLNPLTIPSALYNKLLDQKEMQIGPVKDMLALHIKRQKSFQNALTSSFYREIYPIELIDQMASPNGYSYHDMVFFGSIVKASPSDVLEHLEYLAELLEKNGNYNIALTSLEELFQARIHSWSLRADIAVLIYITDDRNQPFVIQCKESTVLQGFNSYFEDLWGKIPLVDRDKELVLQKLRNRIERLKFTLSRN